MTEKKLSCIDCAVTNCNNMDGAYPDFCLTTHMDEAVLADAMQCYGNEEERKVSQVSASVEHDGYCEWCRVEELIVFARRMGYKKLGIATCVGLISESRKLAQILRNHGFEVYGVACKCGTQRKDSVGCDPSCNELGVNMCNPVLQAKLLNAEKTDFNIVMGLCVGHDSLFYKHSDALVTTLVAKDRVLGHNPAAALYQADFYYRKLKEDSDELK
ncbi:MAG: DUF1847 domain-containing protein [Clostridiales bacterium]|nr:DUF1847 domain-containing protein [Candidatus Crickella caballi]